MRGSWLVAVWVGLALATAAAAQTPANNFEAKGAAITLVVDDSTKEAERFTSSFQFSKLEVQVAEASAGSAFTLTLYRWRGNYTDTVAPSTRQVVAQKTIEVSAPGWVGIPVPVQPAGIYLWEASAVQDKPGVSLAAYDGSTYLGGESFTNGTNDKEIEKHEGGGVPDDLSTGDNAQHFTAANPFNTIQVYSPTWNDETGQKGYTLKLFRWLGDYDSTIAGTPIASASISNFKDNAYVSLFFPTQPAGDYLWLATNPVKPPIGHWRSPTDMYPGEAYHGGVETDGDYPMYLGYPASGTDAHTDLASRIYEAANLPNVTITSPANDTAVSTNPPTFTWDVVPGATAYTVDYSLSFNFDPTATTSATVSTNSFTPAAPLPLGRWYWRVKATLPQGDTDYTTATYQQTLVPPAAGGEVILDDFETVSDWVMRALTLSLSQDEKHGGAASMKVDFPTNYGFAAVDSPLGRLIPKTTDGQNPTALFLWLNPQDLPDPSIDLMLNVTTADGQMSNTPLDLLPITIDPADVGVWTKKTVPLDIEYNGLPLNDPSRTLSLFQISRGRADQQPAQAVTIFFDDFGAVYPKSSAPAILLGDLNADGKVTVSDVVIALNCAVGLRQPTAEQLAAVDFGKTGNVTKITVPMVVKVLQIAVGLLKP